MVKTVLDQCSEGNNVVEFDASVLNTGLAVLSGGLVGLSLAATGGGGALLAVPLLVYVLRIPVQAAVGISLILVGVSAWIGVWQQRQAGKLKVKVAAVFSSTGMMGAWVGAQGHQLVHDKLVLLLFGMLMLMISARMLKSNSLGDDHGHMRDADEFPRSYALKVTVLGLGVGVLTGFFGVGGGFVIVPSLVFVLGFPMRVAIPTSLLIIALISVGGIVGHFQVGSLDILALAFLIVGSTIGMVLGTQVAKRVSSHTLSKLFASVAIVIAISLVLDNISDVLFQ